MKQNSLTIQNKIQDFLASKGFKVHSLQFIPIGEDSYSWSAISETGKVFIKLNTVFSNHSKIKQVNKLLQTLSKYDFIVAPLMIDEATEFSLEEGLLYVYPFIDGEPTKMGNEVFDKKLIDKLIEILSVIHTIDINLLPELEKTTFDNPFTKSFADLKATLKDKEVEKFINKNSEKINQIINNFDSLCKKFQQEKPQLVLTHGDVTGLNIMQTPLGEIKLIDWDGAMITPKERDLNFINDNPNFDLEKYFSLTGFKTCDKEVLKYYGDIWSLDSILDNLDKLNNYDPKYGSREDLWEDVNEYLGYY